MPLPPVTELTPQARNTLRDLLTQLQPYADDSTPQGQAIKERDHYARMWDDVMQEVLKNLEQIRRDYSSLNHQFAEAAAAGSADTNRVIQAIGALHNTLQADHRARQNTAPKPSPAPWWRIW